MGFQAKEEKISTKRWWKVRFGCKRSYQARSQTFVIDMSCDIYQFNEWKESLYKDYGKFGEEGKVLRKVLVEKEFPQSNFPPNRKSEQIEVSMSCPCNI